jgi:hypothetical protein
LCIMPNKNCTIQPHNPTSPDQGEMCLSLPPPSPLPPPSSPSRTPLFFPVIRDSFFGFLHS